MSILRGIVCLLTVLVCTLTAPLAAEGSFLAETCTGSVELNYANPQNYYSLGAIARPRIVLGAGVIQGGTHVQVNRVRFELDCVIASVPCSDDGSLASYVGNITTTCPTTWTANSPGGALPNEVVFTASPVVLIPANAWQFCDLQFDIVISAFPSGTQIGQAAGFLPAGEPDAVCNTPGRLPVRSVAASSIQVCACEDQNVCTTEACDPTLGCIYAPVCEDHNACTMDMCDPGTGQCTYMPIPPCDDNNACTSDTCNPATGCVYTTNTMCNDQNACTTDVCDRVTGQCTYTPIPPCNDNNTCTTDTCNPTSGCLFTNTTEPCDDGNVCTANESCVNGSCQPGELPTGTPCEDGNACTVDDACLAGVCHGTLNLPPQVNNSVGVTKQGTMATISWSDDPGDFAIYRGEIPFVAAWEYNHVCLGGPTPGQSVADGDLAPLGSSWYYLVTRRSACAESIPGQGSNGVPIPNQSPCP